MIPIRSYQSKDSYVFREFELLPLWKRSSKSALLAFSVLAEGSLSSIKEGRQISVTISSDRLSAYVRIKKIAASLEQHKIPFLEAPVNPYPIYSEEDRFYVSELLKTLDEANLFTIGVKMFRLAEIGSHIGHVHPFTFLKIILSDPILKEKLQRIFGIAFKRLGMMNQSFLSEGFGNQLEREKKRNNLEPYIEEFSASFKITAKEIRPLIEKGAWSDLCFYLLARASPRVHGPSPV